MLNMRRLQSNRRRYYPDGIAILQFSGGWMTFIFYLQTAKMSYNHIYLKPRLIRIRRFDNIRNLSTRQKSACLILKSLNRHLQDNAHQKPLWFLRYVFWYILTHPCSYQTQPYRTIFGICHCFVLRTYLLEWGFQPAIGPTWGSFAYSCKSFKSSSCQVRKAKRSGYIVFILRPPLNIWSYFSSLYHIKIKK